MLLLHSSVASDRHKGMDFFVGLADNPEWCVRILVVDPSEERCRERLSPVCSRSGLTFKVLEPTSAAVLTGRDTDENCAAACRFSEYTVCHQESVAVVPSEAPPEKVSNTGWRGFSAWTGVLLHGVRGTSCPAATEVLCPALGRWSCEATKIDCCAPRLRSAIEQEGTTCRAPQLKVEEASWSR